MNEQCKFCIHSCVCAYKGHYEDAVELYEKANELIKVCENQIKNAKEKIEVLKGD